MVHSGMTLPMPQHLGLPLGGVVLVAYLLVKYLPKTFSNDFLLKSPIFSNDFLCKIMTFPRIKIKSHILLTNFWRVSHIFLTNFLQYVHIFGANYRGIPLRHIALSHHDPHHTTTGWKSQSPLPTHWGGEPYRQFLVFLGQLRRDATPNQLHPFHDFPWWMFRKVELVGFQQVEMDIPYRPKVVLFHEGLDGFGHSTHIAVFP